MPNRKLSASELSTLLAVCPEPPSEPRATADSPFLRMFFGDHVSQIRLVETRSHARGDVIIEEGQLGDALYIIWAGRVAAVQGDLRSPRFLNYRFAGEVVGEIAMVEGGPRTASVIAVEETRLLRIGRESLEQLWREHPDLEQHVRDIISTRKDVPDSAGDARPAKKFARDELEQAFRTYWTTGAAGEDWDAWCDLFTEDCLYVEHMYGTMRGRETVRRWIVPIMEKYRELYTAYEYHVVDPRSGRVFLYVQNRRDHPSGKGTIDFPGITILAYAGGGKWKMEEDFWSAKEREAAMKQYEDACRQYDPDHPKKHTRLDWGKGEAWTRGGTTYEQRPRKG